MIDNRRRIAALRAKAASTTFPAEAAGLRAKADELARQEPAPDGNYDWLGGTTIRVTVTGNWFGEAVDFGTTRPDRTHTVRVTDINGRAYWITVK